MWYVVKWYDETIRLGTYKFFCHHRRNNKIYNTYTLSNTSKLLQILILLKSFSKQYQLKFTRKTEKKIWEPKTMKICYFIEPYLLISSFSWRIPNNRKLSSLIGTMSSYTRQSLPIGPRLMSSSYWHIIWHCSSSAFLELIPSSSCVWTFNITDFQEKKNHLDPTFGINKNNFDRKWLSLERKLPWYDEWGRGRFNRIL